MAQDDALGASLGWAGGYADEFAGNDIGFLGYPFLSALAQRPEYRRISEVIATEMTRRWIKIIATGDEDKSERIDRINKAAERLKLRDVFRKAAEQDGFFGRGHVYLDFGTGDNPDELMTTVGGGQNELSQAKVGKGSLKALKVIEAVWSYPVGYGSTNPLAPNWYEPTAWFVMGKQVHASRLLTFIGRQVPDLLKPAYAFGGLSMSQMAMPYVENFRRTRQSVSDLLHSFSVSGVKMNLAEGLESQGDGLFRRAALFNDTRDNQGLMLIDTTEDFFNVSTPLGTLDALQAQSQEQIASVCGVPLIKLLGVTPSGLNASSDGEIRSFYDWIHAYQEKLFKDHLTTVLGFIQLSEFGEVDPDITFIFEPLWSMDEKQKADVNLVEAQTDQTLIAAGSITPTESRRRVAADPDAPYDGLDLDAVPMSSDAAAKVATTTAALYESQLLDRGQALRSLAGTGMFPMITEADIVDAENEPPAPDAPDPDVPAPEEAANVQ